jgi:hypothetical protein
VTAVLEADPRIGATEARLFTPPLPEHADPDAEFGIRPECTWGPICCYFLERILGWHLLRWQRWLYYRALEKRPDGTGFRFRFLVILVARQNGKTKWGMGLGLWRMFMDKYGTPDPNWPAAKLSVVAAQNLDYAETTLKEIVDEVRDQPLLAPELVNHRVTNGKHRMILSYRRYWRAATANKKGGRSLSVDFAWLDELRTHTTPDAWNAVAPTTTVRPCSQVLATSNAGDMTSVKLRELREAAVRNITVGNTLNTKTGFFEWSVPEDVDPRDDQYWYLANPALGELNEFCLEDLHGHFENMEAEDLPGFQTEYLCQWVDALKPGIIPAAAWRDGIDHDSKRAPLSAAYICIELNYHRNRIHIGVAARREDGKIHIEVLPTPTKGTDWLVPWLKARPNKFAGVCIQKINAPASGLIEDLNEALKGVKMTITEWGAPVAVLAASAGEFYDGILDGTIRHRPQQVLDRAAGATPARVIGDAWFFDRRHSPVDASPIIACCGAVWMLNNPPVVEGDPTVWDWPDDDTIEKWRKEAEEEDERERQDGKPGAGR